MKKIISLLLVFSGHVFAEDSVSISTQGGLAPGASRWQSTISINRTANNSKHNSLPNALDTYFSRVKEIVSKEYVRDGWNYSLPEARVVRIEVVLSGKKVVLVSAHPLLEDKKSIALEFGITSLEGKDPKALLDQQSKAFQARKNAFDELLEITMSKIKSDLKN